MFFSDPWPPYIVGGNDAASCGGGVWIDLVDKIFSEIDGFSVTCGLMPWARVLEEARRGNIDGVILLGKNEEREAYLDFVDYLANQRVVVWYSAERFPDGLEWNQITDFEGLKIGKIRKSINGKEFVQAVEDGVPLTIYETVQELALYKMLLTGRIDIAAIPELVAAHTIRKNGWEKRFSKMKKPLAENLIYFAFSKASPGAKLVPEINQILQRMKANGEVERILSGSE